MPLTANCPQCSALQEANDAVIIALEYARKGLGGNRSANYNPAEAMRLARIAASLSDAAPTGHFHSKWYVRDYDDSANDRLSHSVPLELWADHIEWCK